MASRKVFINYRREDSRGDAGRLFDRLRRRFPGQIFMDVSAIEPGLDFVEAIEHAVGSCDACVVVIGKHWLADDAGRRRLDDPEDFVRLEIATALKRNIRVIPVLVSGAAMPSPEDLPEDLRPLTRRNALQIIDQDWDHNVEQLIGAIERALAISPPGGGRSQEGKRPGRLWVGAAGALALVALLGFAMVHNGGFLRRPSSVPTPAPPPKASPVPTPAPAVVRPPQPSAQIRNFSAPGAVSAGEPARLCYQVVHARSARIYPEIGELDPKTLDKDCRTVTPKRTTKYTLTATSLDGVKIDRAVTVTVQAPSPGVQIREFTARPNPVPVGAIVHLSWSVQGARSARIDPGIGELARIDWEGERVFPLTQTTMFTLTATDANGRIVRSQITVQVVPSLVVRNTVSATPNRFKGGCPVTILFTATIEVNQPTTLRYAWTGRRGSSPTLTLPESRTITFVAAGAQTVSFPWTIDQTDKIQGFLRILAPNKAPDAYDAWADVLVECVPSTTVTVSPPPPIYSTGTRTIRGTWCFDFDSGSETDCRDKVSDVWWEQVSGVERYLVPLNGAAFSVWGPSVPSLEDCRKATAGAPHGVGSLGGKGTVYPGQIVGSGAGNQIPDSTYVCGITSEKRFVIFRVASNGYNLVVDFVTYGTH